MQQLSLKKSKVVGKNNTIKCGKVHFYKKRCNIAQYKRTMYFCITWIIYLYWCTCIMCSSTIYGSVHYFRRVLRFYTIFFRIVCTADRETQLVCWSVLVSTSFFWGSSSFPLTKWSWICYSVFWNPLNSTILVPNTSLFRIDPDFHHVFCCFFNLICNPLYLWCWRFSSSMYFCPFLWSAHKAAVFPYVTCVKSPLLVCIDHCFSSLSLHMRSFLLYIPRIFILYFVPTSFHLSFLVRCLTF